MKRMRKFLYINYSPFHASLKQNNVLMFSLWLFAMQNVNCTKYQNLSLCCTDLIFIASQDKLTAEDDDVFLPSFAHIHFCMLFRAYKTIKYVRLISHSVIFHYYLCLHICFLTNSLFNIQHHGRSLRNLLSKALKRSLIFW